jgi:hypothetical protein
MTHRGEKGQAILLVLVAMTIFIVGAAGLAIDGAQMYSHRQMAQAAADAAAQAGIMSIFDATNGTAANPFSTGAAFTCTTTDLRTPCVYARNNGFGGSAGDTVVIDFPDASAAPGVSLSGEDPVNLIRATVDRDLSTGLMKLFGSNTSHIKAIAIAAIVDVVAPIPILVTHPTLSAAMSSNGNPTITICGGPSRSIQVNSSSATSVAMNSNTTVDLSHAGPLGGTGCLTGTGADFGDFGGPATASFNFIAGSLPGKYIQPASPILDPFANVNPPTTAGLAVDPVPAALGNGVSGCPAAPPKACKLYSPGLYTGGIEVKNETGVFKPGVYYMQSNGFKNAANGLMLMATGFADDPDTGPGMLVYNTGNGTGDSFDVGANSEAHLVGSCDTLTCDRYKGILFFQDRTSAAHTASKSHKFGGGGAVSLIGTIYVTNSLAIMTAAPLQYQEVLLQGTPGSNTTITGEIVASTLSLGGNAGIQMFLDPAQVLHIRQVSLVK